MLTEFWLFEMLNNQIRASYLATYKLNQHISDQCLSQTPVRITNARVNKWTSEYFLNKTLINAACAKGVTLQDLKDIKHVRVHQCGFTWLLRKCSHTALCWSTCSCFSVLQRMLLRGIISENFKACQSTLFLERAAAWKRTYIFQMEGKRPSLVLRWC